MSDFVDQCRLEWKRLGVPDALAEEMATDLSSDLRDAETEGLSAEEFLGSSAFDPRSFAATWARERGVVPVSPMSRPAGRGARGLVAFTTVAAIALVITVVLLVTGEPRVSLTTTVSPGAHVPLPGGAAGPTRVSASAAAPIEWLLLGFAVVALGFAGTMWRRRAR
ncbi:MAG TPA: hypothetical protein VHO26_01820 [Propionibacteriaceae bacterium]|nr:hypothetical protein [Propionibacteriaceae bacterium]